jgi:hypothetical protein
MELTGTQPSTPVIYTGHPSRPVRSKSASVALNKNMSANIGGEQKMSGDMDRGSGMGEI